MNDKSVTIDWLSYTIAVPKKERAHLALSGDVSQLAGHVSGYGGEWHPAEALHGYDIAAVSRDKPGLRVMAHSQREDMGVHVSWAGTALQGEDVCSRLKFAIFSNGRISRLDVALDVRAGFDFRKFFEAARDGKLNTKARSSSIIESDMGATVYVGSRSSEQMLRVYDKAAETGREGPWTRIELECKGEKAHAIARYLCDEGLTNIPAVLRAFVDWPKSKEWQAIFKGIVAVGVPKAEKRTDQDTWLRETVYPLLRRRVMDADKLVLDVMMKAASHLPKDKFDQWIADCRKWHDELPF